MADFDWKHPKKIPRGQVEELFELRFLESTPQTSAWRLRYRRKNLAKPSKSAR